MVGDSSGGEATLGQRITGSAMDQLGERVATACGDHVGQSRHTVVTQ